MSTSLLYHGWGLKGYRHVRSHYGGGKLTDPKRTANGDMYSPSGARPSRAIFTRAFGRHVKRLALFTGGTNGMDLCFTI
jgi:hypothetical protein